MFFLQAGFQARSHLFWLYSYDGKKDLLRF